MTFLGRKRVTFPDVDLRGENLERGEESGAGREFRESTPKGILAGCKRLFFQKSALPICSVVILQPQMRDQIFAAQVTKGILELH